LSTNPSHHPSWPRKRLSTPYDLALLLTFAFAPLAHAQQFPQDSTPGKCLPTQHVAPGDGPGGNIFATHFGPQPPDAPNNETATYPTIQPLTPDPIPNDSIPQDGLTYAPFPFSGGINDPVLDSSGGPETSSTTNKGC
jgi:hypothetical protein